MKAHRAILLCACLAGWCMLCAQAPPSMPSWITAYPGAIEHTRRMGPMAESTYTADAPPRDVLSHFRQLFAGVGLKFDPSAAGNGFMIRAATPECDLFIRIHRTDLGTAVQVTCSNGPGRERAVESHHSGIESMEKFDRPVYPQPKGNVPPMPALTWPAWLVRTDGARLPAQKGIDGVSMHYLTSTFLCEGLRNDIQAFYADLLNANGYKVNMRTPETWPQNRKAWVEGTQYLEGRAGRRFVIRIDLTPAGERTTVDLRITAYP